ncbi:MAG: OmpH family outer membrane protein [Bacteroidaceae bacterium]|nr:OmpH family outer membrane protein [Bacteroidaceae bacterium]
MKKTIIVALLALLPFGAFAQKFGHVNSAEIIPLMAEYKTAQTELEDLRKQYMEELNYMQTEYQKKEDDYLANRETLPESIRTRREQELGESQQKIAQYYQDCQVNLEQKQMDLQNGINSKLQKAIQAVGEEGAYVCVFDLAGGGVPFVSSTLTTDVTDAVKAKLGIK